MVDDTHKLFKSSVKEVILWENMIRDSDPKLAQEKRNGNPPLFAIWERDPENEVGPFITRIYKTSMNIGGIFREARIKFIYDKRDDSGKVVIAVPDEYKNILRPIPNPALGISELLVGERVSTSCNVCRVTEGGLGVNIVCPFCKGMEQHICKK
jgi:hypothetical protein